MGTAAHIHFFHIYYHIIRLSCRRVCIRRTCARLLMCIYLHKYYYYYTYIMYWENNRAARAHTQIFCTTTKIETENRSSCDLAHASAYHDTNATMRIHQKHFAFLIHIKNTCLFGFWLFCQMHARRHHRFVFISWLNASSETSTDEIVNACVRACVLRQWTKRKFPAISVFAAAESEIIGKMILTDLLMKARASQPCFL